MLSLVETVPEKILTVLVTAVAVFLAVSAMVSAVCASTVTVVSDKLNVRRNPDKESGSVMILQKGSMASVLKFTDNGWIEIEAKGVRGFVRNRPVYIRVDRKEETKKTPRKTPRVDVTKEIEKRTREIRKIGSEIKKHQGEILQFSEKEKSLLKELNDIDRNVSASRAKAAALKKEIRQIEEDITANTGEREKLKAAVKQNEAYFSKRLVALYKMYNMGRMNVLASAESMYGLINRQKALEYILKQDEKILGGHLESLARLKTVETSLAENRKKAENYRLELVVKIRDIEGTKKKRSALLSEIRQKKSIGLAAVASLKESARELDQTIRSLDQGFAGEDDGKDMPVTSFTVKKGAMRMPVKGRVVSYFGKTTNNEFKVETFQSGIDIRADRGEPVQAVGAGQVLFSDWLKGYGNLIIIDHGNSYYSLYAHNEEVFKKKGEAVEDREVIATVGDTGSLSGPLLHFEIRHKGDPIDPMSWIKK
jgi:septal ring factor EnvC (AmiA/AmiB activator)